jgi:hypothetical protein
MLGAIIRSDLKGCQGSDCYPLGAKSKPQEKLATWSR